MRHGLLIAALAVAAGLAWLLGFGGMDAVAARAAAGQEAAQRSMAGALRALRAGEPGALAALWGLCFVYGFFHAAGPGHGKLLIGGAGVATRVPLARLSVLALASALAQGATAVLLVGAGLLLLDWGRQDMVSAAEGWFAPASYAAIALVGLWLALRGLRALVRAPVVPAAEPVCASCGHAHGPSVAQAQALTGWRDGAALVGAIALRPCTGALFVLILTFGWGLVWQGVTAVLAMALGVASVTIGVGAAAVTLREGALRRGLAGLSGSGPARALSLVEIAVGAGVALVAGGLMLRAL